MNKNIKAFVFVLFGAHLSLAAAAQSVPIRFSSEEAMRRVEKQVEPAPVTTVPGNAVTADVIIATDGVVEAVRVLEGQPAHVQPAIEAFRQWKFSPFSKDGKTVRAIVKLAVYVPDAPPSNEPALTVTASARLAECTRLVNSREFDRAETACTRAVEAADRLRSGAVLERSSAHAWLGHALLFQGRAPDALVHYNEEVTLAQRVLKSDDADLASAYWHIGRARLMMREFSAADKGFERAVTTMESAIVSLPSMRENYQERLKTMLLEHAEVKRSLGDQPAAAALEAKAVRIR
jgi:hypothetical protein